ncbi:DUF5686 and carboxypeptidase regulatory-like domain-containing protein [Paraflavisolibacter sp. H34]|uniref:DUF5686 and carboxypeptidase regulatory-like domain-containing protein n=1 Tax=Huijunlia imazamoxiresistens TaxID=3127457 RepID=UPI00301AE34B
MRQHTISRIFILFLLLLSTAALHAQVYKVQGQVLTSQAQPIPFATIRVKELRSGTTAGADGHYELALGAGDYHLQVSMIGFKPLELPLRVSDSVQRDIVLEEEAQNLSEVVVRVKARDRAEEIMRQVIRKKDSIQAAAGAYSYRLYIKGILHNQGGRPSKKELAEWNRANRPDLEMTEVLAQVDVQPGGRLKEERLAVSGTGKNLFYLSATEGDFNIHNNLINVPAISPTPFLSPVSNAGLIGYKFRTTKIQRTGKHRVYTFSIKPLQVTNATVEGELTVSDSSWTVLHARFRFPSYHLQEFDFFEVEQDYDFASGKAWMLSRQQFTYYTRGRGRIYSGQTLATYSNYELNKQFGKRHFGAEVSATAAEAYTRDTAYWKTVRTEPLSDKEALYVAYADSLQRISRSEAYLDSLDRLVNRLTWQKVGLFGQSFQDHRKERIWHFPGVASLYQPIAFGGSRLRLNTYYSKTSVARRHFNIFANLSYGFRNNDINGTVDLYRRYNPFNRGFYTLSAGREFAFINEGDAWINMIQRNNFYLNNYVGAGYGLEVLNGLVVSADAKFALRQSVAGYKTGKLADSLLTNVVTDNQAVTFQPYNAVYGKLKLAYTPGQRYRREPKEKVILGSKWPTLYLLWEKGIPGIGRSAVDFDYLEAGLEQSLKLGLAGISRYTIKTGDYLNRKDLRFIDYKFQRRGDPLLFMNPYKSFQALDSTFPVFHRFFEGHLLHEFNGLFLNKIPLLKKLQLREVGGAGFLIAPERHLRYGELYVGIERAFQSPFNPLDRFKLGVYVVSSVSNQFRDPVQFKVGFTTWDKRKNKWF